MKNINNAIKYKLLFPLLLLYSFSSYSQTQINFGLYGKNHPADFLEQPPSGTMEYSPILGANLGIRRNIKHSHWAMEATISYMHTRETSEVTLRFTEPDPLIEDTKITSLDLLNFIGLKAGVAYGFYLGHGTDRISLPIGIEAYIPFACKRISEMGYQQGEQKLYRKDYFQSGIFYGLYFKPSYHFNFSKSRDYPWSLGLYAETDLLLMLKRPKPSPKLIYGGGLEVIYRLE